MTSITRLGTGRWLALATALTLLSACSTTTTTTSPAAAPSRDVRNAGDTPDPLRRAQARLELAGLYFARGQAETALSELKEALSAKPDMPEAYSLRGLVYASLGDSARADDSFRRALELSPRDGDVMNNYGWFLCQEKRYDQADAQFERALAQPTYREAARTLLAQGVCRARAGRWPEAERSLLRSYELDPASPFTAFSLSEVLLQRGELDRARFYVQRINAQPDLATAQSLWLAARIERRLGNMGALQDLGRQLRDRFPQSSEALQFEQGRFDG
jgi:type IV pilus assembly protein PilF